MIHPLAFVKSARIGEGTTVWQFSVILEGAVIGKSCNICSHTYIENNVLVGDNVTIKNGVYLWDGLTIEDSVFIGPGVVFTNDLYPRSKGRSKVVKTVVEKGASIGANASVVCGIIIGRYSMIGIGSVVTKNVPSYALVYGNPAKIVGWVDESGKKLKKKDGGMWVSQTGVEFVETDSGLKRK